MEENKIKLIDWQILFNRGDFESYDFDTQVKAGWYDWFCHDKQLAEKTKEFGNIIKQFKNGGKIDLNKSYVWFKNNFPAHDDQPMYDTLNFSDLETGETSFKVVIGDGDEKSHYVVYSTLGDIIAVTLETNSLMELVEWFNIPYENNNDWRWKKYER